MTSPSIIFKSSLKNLKQHSKRILSNKRARPALFIVAFAIIGIVALLATRATTPFASLEPEQGTKATSVSTMADISASGGQFIQFGSGSVSPPDGNIDHGEDINATNTGYKAYYAADLGRNLQLSDLTQVGNVESTSDGQVIERLWIKGRVKINHNNVTVRGVYIDFPTAGAYGITWDATKRPTGTTVEYCEANGNSTEGIAIYIGHAVISRCNIYGFKGGGHLLNGSATRSTKIQYSYIHDLHYFTGSHNTSISTHEQQYLDFYRNNLDDGSSAALSLYCDESHISGSCQNINITENLFNVTRANYCVRVADWNGNSPEPKNIKYNGNKFGKKYFATCGSSGPLAQRDIPFGVNGNEWQGNTWQDTGQIIP